MNLSLCLKNDIMSVRLYVIIIKTTPHRSNPPYKKSPTLFQKNHRRYVIWRSFRAPHRSYHLLEWSSIDYKFKTFTGILNTSLSYNAYFVFEHIGLKIHFVSEILPTSVIGQFFRTFFLLKSIFFKYIIFTGDLDLNK
jgi:hypothetical protein